MKNTLADRKKSRIGSNTVMLMITIALFILLYGAGCLMYADKEFGRLQNFLNVMINNAGLIIVACGVTCVMLTGGIDISVGSVVAMTCMFMSVGLTEWGMSSGVLIALILLIGVVFGWYYSRAYDWPFPSCPAPDYLYTGDIPFVVQNTAPHSLSIIYSLQTLS